MNIPAYLVLHIKYIVMSLHYITSNFPFHAIILSVINDYKIFPGTQVTFMC